jgi:TolB protein
VEGGELKTRMPRGYYVDFTALASDYGWERVPSLWRWRHFWPDIRWWEYQKSDSLSWWDCMLEIFTPREIEAAFGPIPGYEEED